MKVATVVLESVSPYSQNRHHEEPYLEKELPKDYEKRTWRKKLHTDENGIVFIPPMAFKICLSEAAAYLGIKIPGQAAKTYTNKFKAGLLINEAVILGIKAEDVQGECIFMPVGSKKNAGRVDKWFPVIPKWSATVTFYILDETITEDVFREHLDQAGKFIGIGRFRPLNNGLYGRFKIVSLTWK